MLKSLTIALFVLLFLSLGTAQTQKVFTEEELCIAARAAMNKAWDFGLSNAAGTASDTLATIKGMYIPQLVGGDRSKAETSDDWVKREFGLMDLFHGLATMARHAGPSALRPIIGLRLAKENEMPGWKNSVVWICPIQQLPGSKIVAIKWVIHFVDGSLLETNSSGQPRILGISRSPLGKLETES